MDTPTLIKIPTITHGFHNDIWHRVDTLGKSVGVLIDSPIPDNKHWALEELGDCLDAYEELTGSSHPAAKFYEELSEGVYEYGRRTEEANQSD
jgi:hypothetical protein